MRLVVIGVNHKTAPVALRERLAFVGNDLNTALTELKVFTDGSVIVSTCNRTEIYVLVPQAVPQLADADSSPNNSSASNSSASMTAATDEHIVIVKQWLAKFKNIAVSEIEPFCMCTEIRTP